MRSEAEKRELLSLADVLDSSIQRYTSTPSQALSAEAAETEREEEKKESEDKEEISSSRISLVESLTQALHIVQKQRRGLILSLTTTHTGMDTDELDNTFMGTDTDAPFLPQCEQKEEGKKEKEGKGDSSSSYYSSLFNVLQNVTTDDTNKVVSDSKNKKKNKKKVSSTAAREEEEEDEEKKDERSIPPLSNELIARLPVLPIPGRKNK